MAEPDPFAEFAALGEPTVRDKLAKFEFGAVEERRAREWLAMLSANKPEPWHKSWWGSLLLAGIRYLGAALFGYLAASFQHRSWPFS